MSTKFLEESPGNWSVSRLIAVGVIGVAILDSNILMFWALLAPRTDLMAIATAAGVLFASIATPAMGYLFLVKKDEIKGDLLQLPTLPPSKTE